MMLGPESGVTLSVISCCPSAVKAIGGSSIEAGAMRSSTTGGDSAATSWISTLGLRSLFPVLSVLYEKLESVYIGE
jgi:hypothetical protein